MRLTGVLANGVAVITSATLILATILWGDIPGTPITQAELDELLQYPGTISYEVVPSTVQVITTLVAVPAALILVAVFAGAQSARRKCTVGGVASACSALIAFAVLALLADRIMEVDFVRAAIRSVVVAASAFLLGATSVWVSLKWWPINLLERTRER